MAGTYKTVLNKGKFSRITAIGIGVVVSVPLLLFGWFALQGAFTRASDDEPRDVVVTNITSNSAKVEWTTGQATQGIVEYGTAEQALVFFAPETQQSVTHSVELTLLTPSTTHYFQIKIGDKVYTNSGTGKPWQFTTRTKDGELVVPSPEEDPSGSTSADLTEVPIATLIPEATVSATGIVQIITSTPVPTSGFIPTATSTALSCNESDCQRIKQKLGLGCTATDYIRCLNRNGVTIIPTNTGNPTAVPTTKATITNSECHLSTLQGTSCRTWTWTSMDTKPQACRNAFYRYVLRCKNNSLYPTPGSNVSPEITYFDGSITAIASNSATIPGLNFPTPGASSTVYCAIRAEDVEGGDSHSTPWLYASSTCN